MQHDTSLSNYPDIVVNAIVGFAGLEPTLEALKANKILCLANKESLVVGGELINSLLKKYHGSLYPIDSEHSAIWKCLKVSNENVDKLILTASGGAFRKLYREELRNLYKACQELNIPCSGLVFHKNAKELKEKATERKNSYEKA